MAADPTSGAVIGGVRPRARAGLRHPAAAAVARGASTSRRADIQGLRAVAVTLVVVFHAGLPLSGGFIGVDVFFVISGFVITTMLVNELERSGGIDLVGFYARRIKRLLPALAVMLATVALLGALLSPAASQRMSALTGITASLFAANAYLFNLGTGYFDVDTSLNPLLHTWTLAVEEQFYLVFPMLLLVSWRLARRLVPARRRAVAGATVGGATLVSFLLSLQLSGAGVTGGFSTPERLAFYGSPTRAWEFGAGVLVALASPWVARLTASGALVIGCAGAVAVGIGASSIDETMALPGTAALLPVCGACGLLLAGTRSGGYPGRVLGIRPAVWVGDLSYSWYLWHWPLIVFATALWPGSGTAAPAAAVFSLLPSWLSYRFVENPIRFRPGLSGRRVVALATVCVLVPVGASVGLLGVQRALQHTSTMRSWTRSQALHADAVRGCYSPIPLDERAGYRCTWAVRGSRGDVVLVGDSNAGHFTEPLVRAANAAGFDATVATFSSCPFVDVRIVEGLGPGAARCRRFFAGTMDALLRLRPALVIVAARTDKYIEEPAIALRDRSGRAVYGPDEKAGIWKRGLQSTLERLNRAGVRVVVVHPVPSFPGVGQECTVLRILRNGCASIRPYSAVERRLSRSLRAEDGAVAATSASWAIDLSGAICQTGSCATVRRGVILYRDPDHLSIDGALTLTSRFRDAVVAHAATGKT